MKKYIWYKHFIFVIPQTSQNKTLGKMKTHESFLYTYNSC